MFPRGENDQSRMNISQSRVECRDFPVDLLKSVIIRYLTVSDVSSLGNVNVIPKGSNDGRGEQHRTKA